MFSNSPFALFRAAEPSPCLSRPLSGEKAAPSSGANILEARSLAAFLLSPFLPRQLPRVALSELIAQRALLCSGKGAARARHLCRMPAQKKEDVARKSRHDDDDDDDGSDEKKGTRRDLIGSAISRCASGKRACRLLWQPLLPRPCKSALPGALMHLISISRPRLGGSVWWSDAVHSARV